jgi:phage/plasmid-associated DNA primase
MPESIQYATKLNAFETDIKTCKSVEVYKELCENFDVFEKIPDNTPVHPYFDIDYYDEELEYDDTNTQSLIDFGKHYLTNTFQSVFEIEPNFAVKTSSSASYEKKGKLVWKNSIHLHITNCKILKSQLGDLIKDINEYSKSVTGEFSFVECWKFKDNKFFDESIYDANRKLRAWNSSKPDENRKFILHDGKFEQTIVTPLQDDTSETITYFKKSNNSIKSHSSIQSSATNNIQKYQDYVGIIKQSYFNEYATWFKFQRASANIGIPFDVYDAFMRGCESYDYDENKKYYETPENNKNGRLGWGYIYEIAKESNAELKEELDTKYNKQYYINADDLEDTYKVANIISATLKDTLKLCKENWYMLTETQLWKQQKEPSYYIINELRKYIDESNKKTVYKISKTDGDEKEKLIETSKKYLKSYKSISSPSFLNVLTKYLKTLLADDAFAEKLDNNKGMLSFKNGIMDLRTKEFRHGILSEDYITQTIPYDYQPSTFEYLKGVLKKILNNNDEHLDYFLSIIGYSFIGQPDLEKSIYFMIDKTENSKGDNGKTFFFSIMSELMPNYVYQTKASLIETNNSKVHKQLVMTKGKRLVWLDELPKEKDTNADMMKVIGDGKQMENEIMFGTSEIINIMWKMFALSNNTPKINPNETAVYNRLKQVSFNSHFDRTGERKEDIPEELKFVADATLATTIKDKYFNEVFNIIIHYANLYYQRGIPAIPKQFVKDTKDTQNSNDEFGLWFSENCEICETEKVALKALISESEMTKKTVMEGMTRKGFKYNKDLSGLGKDENNKAHKGGYVGIKLKTNQLDE